MTQELLRKVDEGIAKCDIAESRNLKKLQEIRNQLVRSYARSLDSVVRDRASIGLEGGADAMFWQGVCGLIGFCPAL